MAENKRFIKALNFINLEHNLNVTDVSEKIGVKRTKLYNVVNGRQKVDDDLIQLLVQKFPDVKKFFKQDSTKTEEIYTDELKADIEKLAMLKEAVADKSEIIKFLRKEIKALKKENAGLWDKLKTVTNEDETNE